MRSARALTNRVAFQQRVQRRQGGVEPLALLVREERQAGGEPCRAPRPDALQQRLTLTRELEPDTTAVVRRADAPEEAGCLEAVDVPRERRGGDALLDRELAKREAGSRAHEPQERDLVRGDPEGLGLAPEVPREPEERRAELLGDLLR